MKILVIGESCKDIFVYGECDRICPEAPVPVFIPVAKSENAGMAMNVKNNILSLGCKGEIITNTNWEEVKKCRYIDERTNQMFLRVDENDKIVAVCDDKLKSFIETNINDYDAVVISDYCKGFFEPEFIEQICELHDTVFLDTKKLLGAWCKKAKFIKINEVEYNRTKHLVDEEIRNKLIITRGSRGCWYQDEIFEVPRVEIKDVSGAGDTFIAALAVSYIKDRDIRTAIKFANDKATKVVQHRGVSIV
jgi:bifunctional ADP-heptose synthase (sugar kinase/adenylyltransferase)